MSVVKSISEPFANWLADELPNRRRPNEIVPPPPAVCGVSAGKIRFAKINFAMAALHLEDLGVDVQKIDLAEVVRFGRTLARF